jgi:hypothetical protein
MAFVPKPLKTPEGPEAKIQRDLIAFLRMREWFVKETHGNCFQQGFPDLWCNHISYGARWIEVKNPECYSFTGAQQRDFPMFCRGSGVWILCAPTEDEYSKLWEPPNWSYYLRCYHLRVKPQLGHRMER